MSEHSPSKVVRNVLSDKQSFALIKLVEAEWLNRIELGDEGFAAFAAEKLGFSVSGGNVKGARKVLDLPSYHAVAHPKRSSSIEIAELQRRIERLEQRIEVYFRGCTKDRVLEASP